MPDKLHNAECRVQNAELMKSLRNGEKIFNGIYRCLCARKIVVRYRESCVSSTAFLQLPHDCVLPMQNASFILHSAFCILHLQFIGTINCNSSSLLLYAKSPKMSRDSPNFPAIKQEFFGKIDGLFLTFPVKSGMIFLNRCHDTHPYIKINPQVGAHLCVRPIRLEGRTRRCAPTIPLKGHRL